MTLRHLFPFLAATLVFANDRASNALAAVGFANQLPDESGAPEWIEIPYGEHMHSNGMQLFDREAADLICANFRSDLVGILRGGVPFYVGHPDVPAFANTYKDKSARGWVKQVEATDKALRLRVKWNTAGESLIANEEYKFFSPVWSAQPVPGRAKTYRPARLRSVGLTNEPNLPVEPLTANEQLSDQMNVPEWLLTMLGLKPEATEDEIKAAVQALLDKLKAAEELPKKMEKMEQVSEQLANERSVRQVAQLNFANERAARIDLLLANAIGAGKITEAQKEGWRKDLTESFDSKSIELANAKPVVSTNAHTRNLGDRKVLSDPAQQAVTLANERMEKTGQSWDVCWKAIQRDRPDLFTQMKQPAEAN